ncbi:PAS domain-containing protein [Aureococcus anophagefferens]|nr:PAS domain-containing protein [Aureococcus anophagefferens]
MFNNIVSRRGRGFGFESGMAAVLPPPKHVSGAGRAASVASALLGNGRFTGIRKHGQLGPRVQSPLLRLGPPGESLDVGGALRKLLARSGAFRCAFEAVLSEPQVETLRFVEAAEALRGASRSREQERALTLAAQLFKTHVVHASRAFAGIGLERRTAATGEIWAADDLRQEAQPRAAKESEIPNFKGSYLGRFPPASPDFWTSDHLSERSRSAQPRSYAVVAEVLDAADRRWKLLVLEAFPVLCAATDWDALLAEVYADGAEQLLDVALKRRVYDGPSWLRLVGDLFEASDVPLTVSDVAVPGNPLVFGNAAFRDLVGYDFDEFLGRNCRFLQGPASEPEALACLSACLQERQDCEVVLTNYRKNGQMFRNLVSFRPLFDADGGYRFVLCVQHEAQDRDILERRRNLRRLDDVVTRLPRHLPFGGERVAEAALAAAAAAADASERTADPAARARRLVFALSALGLALDGERALGDLLASAPHRAALKQAAADADFGSPAAAWALDAVDAVSFKRDVRYKRAATGALAADFLPQILESPGGPQFVKDLVKADGEADRGVTAARDVGDLEDPGDFRELFVACLKGAMEHSALACICCDVARPGAPIVFANDAFLALAGAETETDVLEENCRLLQCAGTRAYLVEELRSAVRGGGAPWFA